MNHNTILPGLYKFNIGDRVKIIKPGRGCSPSDIGKEVNIVRLGTYSLRFATNGYIVNPPIGNSKSGSYGRMIEERTFELVSKEGNIFEF